MLKHRIIRGWWITVVLLSLFVLPLLATPYTNVGEAFELGMGARPLAMGGAFVGLIDDESALFSNPANLAWGEKLTVLSALQTRLATASCGDILASFNNFAIGVHYFDFGDVPETDESGNVTGYFSYRNYTFAAAAGLKIELPSLVRMGLGESIGWGVRAKLFRIETLTPGNTTGVSVDVSLLFRGELSNTGGIPIEGYALGLLVENLVGTPISYGSGHEEELPRRATIGGSLLLADHAIISVDLTSTQDVRFGVEWTPTPALSIRGGLKNEGVWIWSMGIGTHVKDFVLDFAVVLHPDLNTELCGSLAVYW